ncbi:MAG TPA: ATP-binding protein [Tepidisphaeraceae bacterium]|jgi:serine/threonine-protein kinase RsbW
MTPQQAPTNVRLKILSDPANLAGVRQSVEALCAANGFATKACEEVGLCVNEAMANVIRHAYDGAEDKPIEVSAEITSRTGGSGGGAVRIAIRDWGNGVNPETLPQRPRDPLKPGGLGLICLRQMMHEVVFTPQPDGMLLEMTRYK